jgi:hypothetical protein
LHVLKFLYPIKTGFRVRVWVWVEILKLEIASKIGYKWMMLFLRRHFDSSQAFYREDNLMQSLIAWPSSFDFHPTCLTAIYFIKNIYLTKIKNVSSIKPRGYLHCWFVKEPTPNPGIRNWLDKFINKLKLKWIFNNN